MPKAATVTQLEPNPRFFVDEEYAKECLSTPPPEALQEDFMRYAPDLAWWGERVADAKREVALVNLELETAKADADARVRDELARAGGKTTEDAVKNAVRRDPQVLAAARLSIDAEHYEARVRAVHDAVKAKRDMLVGLGANFRAEMQADPALRA